MQGGTLRECTMGGEPMCCPQGETLQEVEGSKRCIWPCGCHCRSLSLAPVNPDWFYLSWCRLTQVVLEKRPLNGCNSSSSVLFICLSTFTVRNLFGKQLHTYFMGGIDLEVKSQGHAVMETITFTQLLVKCAAVAMCCCCHHRTAS